MATSCDLAAEGMGTGVAAALTAVDCIALQVSEQAFGRLFGTDGQLAFVLTMLLILYVAFFGISLMLGRSNISIRALVPRMMTIGLVLTFATSFAAFSAIFYNVFVGGPDQIASVLTGSQGSATATFAQKLDIVFLAVQEASNASGAQTDISLFSAQGMMWAGAMMLLLGTVGLLVTARIGLALLLAVGPIFVVLALFNGTRGLFTGWLKGVTMLAIAPLFAVLGGSIMLEIAVPILSTLVAVPGQIDQQAAMAFFVLGFVHCALMMLALIVAVVMVGKWQVFGLVPSKEVGSAYDTARTAQAQVAAQVAQSAPAAAPTTLAAGRRRTDIAQPSVVVAANDSGAAATSTVRETRVYATSSGGGQAASLNPAASRTRGIGNRFRSTGAIKTASKPETTK